MQDVATARQPTIQQLLFRLVAQSMERKLQEWREQACNSTFVSAHPTLAKSMWTLPRLDWGAAHLDVGVRGVLDELEGRQRCALCYRVKEVSITKVTFFGEWVI